MWQNLEKKSLFRPTLVTLSFPIFLSSLQKTWMMKKGSMDDCSRKTSLVAISSDFFKIYSFSSSNFSLSIYYSAFLIFSASAYSSAFIFSIYFFFLSSSSATFYCLAFYFCSSASTSKFYPHIQQLSISDRFKKVQAVQLQLLFFLSLSFSTQSLFAPRHPRLRALSHS